MAEGKKSFITYVDWKDTFDSLPNDLAGELIKHIFAYVNDENPISENVTINAAFANIKNTLKRDLCKWDKQHEQRVLAGQESARLRKEALDKLKQQALTTVERPLNETQQTSTVSVNGSVSVSVIKTKEDIYVRKLKFSDSLKPFLEKYGRDMLNNFNSYWTEPNKSGTKMRFETEKTWEITRRLERWAKNNKDFKQPVKLGVNIIPNAIV
ncbi:MAG: DUF6291 domain-containing protein [Bacteroidia bacterium]